MMRPKGGRVPLLLLLLALPAFLAQTACPEATPGGLSVFGQQEGSSCGRPFTPLAECALSGGPSLGPEVRVLEDDVAWYDFWHQEVDCGADTPEYDRDLLDFSRSVVLVAIGGLRLNNCFSGRIVCIEEAGDGSNDLNVVIEESTPGRGCLCGDMLQTWISAAMVDRPVGRVTLEIVPVVYDCQ